MIGTEKECELFDQEEDILKNLLTVEQMEKVKARALELRRLIEQKSAE